MKNVTTGSYSDSRGRKAKSWIGTYHITDPEIEFNWRECYESHRNII